MKNIKADKHYGCSRHAGGQTISNGQKGIDKKKGVLVVCCSNCGDYTHVDLSEIRKAEAK